MTREDITRMAREAGFNPVSYMGANLESFERFAALVAAHDRKRTDASSVFNLQETRMGLRLLRCRQEDEETNQEEESHHRR